MGIKRYELSEAQWRRIEAMLPGKASDPGRTAADIQIDGSPTAHREAETAKAHRG